MKTALMFDCLLIFHICLMFMFTLAFNILFVVCYFKMGVLKIEHGSFETNHSHHTTINHFIERHGQ